MTTSSPDTFNEETVCSSSDSEYFNLHIDGVGYVNRIREVPPKKGKRGEPFLACDISALLGPRGSVEYRYYDVRVSGKDAQHLIRRCQPAAAADKKVLIGFRLGDPWIDIFKYKDGHPKAGQTGVSQKARLLFVSWIKIDGELVYRAEKSANEEAGEQARAAADAPASTKEPALAASF